MLPHDLATLVPAFDTAEKRHNRRLPETTQWLAVLWARRERRTTLGKTSRWVIHGSCLLTRVSGGTVQYSGFREIVGHMPKRLPSRRALADHNFRRRAYLTVEDEDDKEPITNQTNAIPLSRIGLISSG
jgi:hypothetical protein